MLHKHAALTSKQCLQELRTSLTTAQKERTALQEVMSSRENDIVRLRAHAHACEHDLAQCQAALQTCQAELVARTEELAAAPGGGVDTEQLQAQVQRAEEAQAAAQAAKVRALNTTQCCLRLSTGPHIGLPCLPVGACRTRCVPR